MKVSIILPCRNEEESIGQVISQIKKVVRENNIDAQIIVSDSSSDSSFEIAKSLGVDIVKHDKEGYGTAYLEGFKAAKGDYIFIADADSTYDFNEIPRFLKYLEEGYDFVIGNRFGGKMEKGAMPFLHRYVGNPVLSGLFRIFFNSNIKDVHCGMRALSRKAWISLDLQSTGMEFASEMILKAVKRNFKIKQLPINYHARKGSSKLKTFNDGWRHLRFMLLYSPFFLFFVPGFLFALIGFIFLISFYFFNFHINNITFYVYPMFIFSLFTIFGYQLMFFSLFSKIYSIVHLQEKDRKFEKFFRYFNLEKGILFGALLILFGILFFGFVLFKWISTGFGELNEIKNSVLALTFFVLGIQTVFFSFMLSILGIGTK